MLYQDLLQAKKEGRWVATPDGVGQLNGIGLASSPVLSPVEGFEVYCPECAPKPNRKED